MIEHSDGTGIDDFDCDGYRPIHHAILAADLGRAEDLVRAGAHLNKPTEGGDGALVLLCRALSDDDAAVFVPALLAWGAEIIDRDRKGYSALHHAISRGLLKTIRALVAGGADPFLRATDGKRPIDLSCGDAVVDAAIRRILSSDRE